MKFAVRSASLSIHQRLSLAAGLACLSICGPSSAGVVLSGGGLILAEESGSFDVGNLALGAGTYPFATGQLGPQIGLPDPYHYITALNNGIYGNPNSWIGGDGDPVPPFAGVGMGGSFSIQSIAFGRSNVTSGDPCGGGVCIDRNLGLYTLQYSNVPGANTANPAADWTTIGTLDYQSAGGGNFLRPWLRHRYNFDPVTATALRMLVPGSGLGPQGTAIDEIEIYANPGAVTPPPKPYKIIPAAGYSIGFDGNNGNNFTPDDPALVPDNPALAANGTQYFASSHLGPSLGIAYHYDYNINDGQYGNNHSWIADFVNGDSDPLVGVTFASPIAMSGFAFGRDNGNIPGDACGGTCMDRWDGTYTVQYSQVPGANLGTGETGDPATGWASIGTIEYLFQDDNFTPWLRHEFTVSLNGGGLTGVTGLRIKVSNIQIAIDEIEVLGSTAPPDAQWAVDSDGSWGDSTNWNPQQIPDGPGSKARFLGAISAPRTVALDGDRFVSEMYFDNANAYTLDGGGGSALVFSNAGGQALVQVDQGHHIINSFVLVADNAAAHVAAGSSLSITQSTLIAGSATLQKTGDGALNMLEVFGDGTLDAAGGTISATYLRNASLAVRAGATVKINANGTDAGTSHLFSLTIDGAPGNWQGKLDLDDNDLVVQASAGDGANVLAQITDQIASGRNGPGGLWQGEGIVSSAAQADANGLTGLGVILNGQDGLPERSDFGGFQTDGDSVLVRYTWNGDSDLSGIVDADDYFRIDSAFAAAGTLLGWANGDFDYSGGVPDADDYFLIDSAFAGQTGVLGAAVAVPEPSALAGLMLVMAGMSRRKRRLT